MPSPTCTINGSATPQDVSANSVVNGALVSGSGVLYWFLTCIGTDETTSPAALNATLSVNQSAKTFSFTSQAVATAYIFQSTVGIGSASQQGAGCDANNQVQPSYTTTFKVNVPTSGGRRVIAENETYEQDPTFGWINEINKLVRYAG